MLIAEKLVAVAAIEQTTNVAHGYVDGARRLAAAIQVLDPRLTIIAVPERVLDPSPAPVAVPSSSAPPAQSEAPFVELTFAKGVPTAINGVAMSFTDLLDSIEMLARSRSARVLHAAHRGLQMAVIADPSELDAVARQYGELIDTGAWFSTARPALDAAVDRLERLVSGTVRLQLADDVCHIVDVKPLEQLELKG
jgi:argininosuccinate synthase